MMDFKSRRWGDSPTPKASLDDTVLVYANFMPSKKTKALLEGLGNITKKPSRFGNQKFTSYTNMYYTSIHEHIHKLPKRYDKVKRYKDSDGDEYIWIDRVYGSIFKDGQTMRQADGTEYHGKLYSKRRLIERKNLHGELTRFYSKCTVTADDRWFDNGGIPIEKPIKLEPEKVKSQEEIEEEDRIRVERAKNKEAAILANLK